VDLTARWCLTCQSNKATAYTPEVRRLFREKGITVLKAGMTVTDPAADKAIHELGRAAIPVNVLYVPGSESPQVTREVLTPGYLTELIEEQIGNK
jgi:thiol:disulfide interchange protein